MGLAIILFYAAGLQSTPLSQTRLQETRLSRQLDRLRQDLGLPEQRPDILLDQRYSVPPGVLRGGGSGQKPFFLRFAARAETERDQKS